MYCMLKCKMMPEYKTITYHSSVQRAVQLRCKNNDDGYHNESYERSICYGHLIVCFSHDDTCGN